jgi:MFS family permease
MDKSQYAFIGSSYFIGYFIGSIFFFMPDYIGRKGTMNRILPLFMISSYFSLFGQTIPLKSFGFFMQGFFHIKVSLSYQHIFELVP